MPVEPAEPVSVSAVRRRFSLGGDSWDLDGIESVATDSKPPDVIKQAGDQLFRLYAGKSQKGYVPYNPRKVNQDYLLMREDEATHTLILGTFDGHGEHGHCVSEVCSWFKFEF